MLLCLCFELNYMRKLIHSLYFFEFLIIAPLSTPKIRRFFSYFIRSLIRTKTSMCCRTIILGLVSVITIGICIAQISFAIHYIHKPVKCERSEFLTILSLVAGSSGILSTALFIFCCHGCGCGSK